MYKLRIKFSKHGPIIFIGHLDIMRYFQKAMRRAEVDISYSTGFSPHQIMSFAAPLGVGLCRSLPGRSNQLTRKRENRKFGGCSFAATGCVTPNFRNLSNSRKIRDCPKMAGNRSTRRGDRQKQKQGTNMWHLLFLYLKRKGK